jgi:hypothetical protein
LSSKQLEAYILDATEAKGIARNEAIGRLREFVFTLPVDTVIATIGVLRSIRQINTILAVGLTSRANEAAMFRRKVLYSTGTRE